jgi:hypothetical protein
MTDTVEKGLSRVALMRHARTGFLNPPPERNSDSLST